MNPSTAEATVLVDELVRNNVGHVVACPGSRNAALLLALRDTATAGELTLHVRVDERSAGFLALGIAARTGQPVVLVCTSGTAAANFHPAVLEADRAGVPLVVCTADRPPELRAAGANQVVDQHRLYGDAVRYYAELAVAERTVGQNAYWRSQVCRACHAACGGGRDGPVHLNIPFRDPLVPGGDDNGDWCESLLGRPDGSPWTELAAADFSRRLVTPESRRGLMIVCDDSAVRAAAAWAEQHNWPVLCESGGFGLAGRTAVRNGMWLLGVESFVAEHKPEQVLCVGRPTVFRQVGRLLADADVEVLLVNTGPDWPAPGHNIRRVGRWLGEPSESGDPEWLASWQRADASAGAAVRAELGRRERPSGLGVAAELGDALPPNALLTVGSSNPTRDIALADGARPDVVLHRNRGVAGIDGTVSTAVGAAIVQRGPAYALLGDLTFLHDLNGLLTGTAETLPNLTIVVVNDDGGGIFSLLEQGAPEYADRFEQVFGTAHGADLGALCRGHGVAYTLVHTAAQLRAALQTPQGLGVVEIRVDRRTHRRLHERMADAVAAALPG